MSSIQLKKGFSLIELLVVVAIIGVLAAIGTVGYGNYVTQTRIKVNATNIANFGGGIQTKVATTVAELQANGSADALAVAKRLDAARAAFVDVVDFVAGQSKASPNAVYAGSVPYLMLAGNLMAGWQLGRSLLVAQTQLAAGVDKDFMQAKISTARFYADHILTKAPGLRDSIVEGADAVTALALEAF